MDTFSKHLNAAHKMLSKRSQMYKSAGGFQKRQHSFILTEARNLGVCYTKQYCPCELPSKPVSSYSWSVSSQVGTQEAVTSMAQC